MAFRDYDYGIVDSKRLLIVRVTLEITEEVRPERHKERKKCKLTVTDGRKGR